MTSPLPKTRGRKKLFPDGKKFNVFLDEATMRKAQKIGGGFISRGLRRAVAEWKEPCAATIPFVESGPLEAGAEWLARSI